MFKHFITPILISTLLFEASCNSTNNNQLGADNDDVSKNDLSPGAALLFKYITDYDSEKLTSAPTLTNKIKEEIFKKMNLTLSKDKKGFYADDECGNQWRDTVIVYTKDLNSDKTPEIMIEYANYCEFGNTGSSLTIFSIEADSCRKIFDDIGGYSPSKGTTNGYSNFILGGPGMTRPLIKWNGKKYVAKGMADFS